MYSFEVKRFEIIIFQSLGKHEIQTGTELADGLLKNKAFYVEENLMTTRLVEISSKTQLLKELDLLYQRVSEEYIFPIIEFEIHGYDDGIGLNNGERVSWSEIVPVLRKINIF